MSVWLQSRSHPARGRAGLEVYRCLCIIDAGNVFTIRRVFFSFCENAASPQATVWAPAWAPRSRSCEHVDNGTSTPEAMPRHFAICAGGATTAKHAPTAPRYGQVSYSSKVHGREGHFPSVQMKLVIFTLFFCSSAECSSPAAAASLRRRQRLGHRPG